MYSQTKEIMLEEISAGINDFNDIKGHKLISLASKYIYERDVLDRDPSLNLNKLNNTLLSNILCSHTEEETNRLKKELAESIIDENIEEIEDLFIDALNEYLIEERFE